MSSAAPGEHQSEVAPQQNAEVLGKALAVFAGAKDHHGLGENGGVEDTQQQEDGERDRERPVFAGRQPPGEQYVDDEIRPCEESLVEKRE